MYKVFKKFNNISFSKVLCKKYSQPAFDNSYYDKYYIDKKSQIAILDHGYICPLCKGSGLRPCKLCKKGCLYCGYSKFILCRCQLDV